jgi:hypothetical protein
MVYLPTAFINTHNDVLPSQEMSMLAHSIQVDGLMTCLEGGAVLDYVLKKDGQTLAEEEGLTSLPGKVFEISATATIFPGVYILTLTGINGVVRVGRIGIRITNSDGSELKVDHEETPAAILNYEGVTQKDITFMMLPEGER